MWFIISFFSGIKKWKKKFFFDKYENICNFASHDWIKMHEIGFKKLKIINIYEIYYFWWHFLEADAHEGQSSVCI